jgi:glyoxylase-like metal-dependent hydrolase (beta-lactamase superfamily II)
LHHITLRVDDIAAALARLKARGARLIDEQARPGAEGALVAFVHPSAAHGVLVELKQLQPAHRPQTAAEHESIRRFTIGDLELIALYDGSLGLDGGAVFGIVPRPVWSETFPPDEQNRVRLAMRPLVVRGARTLLIDAGLGAKTGGTAPGRYGGHEGSLDAALAEAGLRPEDIDIVLATHLHFDHAGGFTVRGADGRLHPRFPRARYVVRRGEWEDATHTHDRNRWSYVADDMLPLAEAGVLDLVDEDQTIMPGVRVRRTGGHTRHHQVVSIESKGARAIHLGDLVPTAAHLRPNWIMGIDLYPVETLSAKAGILTAAAEEHALLFFYHDPATPAAFIAGEGGALRPIPA